MLILGVDTSSPATSLAIVCNQEVLALYHEEHDHPPSDAVFGLLDDLLKKSGFKLKDIDVFAACQGPGSFTGLRIGLGMAKTFAMATKKPIIGIDAVSVLANRALNTVPDLDRQFSVVLQGFKNSTFMGRFRVASGQALLIGDLKTGQGLEEVQEWAAREQTVFVDPKLKWDLPKARVIAYEEPVAVSVARLAHRVSASQEEFPHFDQVQPLYLRNFSVGKKAKSPEDMR